ncbi:ESX secretion-associated protein EspG [Nocardia higoensis]|uniref:ESX secretion-associated protein EspG n=1 Tax=Nocardia higoensis TaxID=228599 RepID=UPI0002F1CD9D|nr:ESX secretion-associated protein EspG [Nocardia higoensis]
MSVLGAAGGPSTLGSISIGLDEMQFLLERLQFDELPVVLQTIGRYDNESDHDAAMQVAERTLVDRGFLVDGVVHRELEDRLRTLYRPHWVLALRLVVNGQINRLALAKGDDLTVVALRGPFSYVLDEVDEDLPGPLIAALGPAEPLGIESMNAETELLAPVFGDTGDAATTANRLAGICTPARDVQPLASALVEIHSHTQISAVVYGDGTREVADSHIAVFDTRGGRIVLTAAVADDGTKWTSISSGSTARLRAAIKDLIGSLPERDEFPQQVATNPS